MKFQQWQRMAALFVGIVCFSFPAAAQNAMAPIAKGPGIARSDRRTSKSVKSESMTSEKKKSKRFSYSYLLPFGVGQFEQEKNVMGTALATAQAGFLLLYFDRINAVRSSNADAADVMRGVDMNSVRNDPTILSFLDQNEAYTLKAQQQANMALMGFFALYTVGVVEAVFDPFSKYNLFGTKRKKRETVERSDASPNGEAPSRLVQELKEEQMATKMGVFYQPAPGSASAVGLSVQKPL